MPRRRKPGPREPNGQPQRPTKRDQEQMRMPMIEARAKQAGCWLPMPARLPGETDESLEARLQARQAALRALVPTLQQPWFSCWAGRYIAAEKDVQELWQIIKGIWTKRLAYLSAIASTPDTPKGMHLGDAPPPDDGTEVIRTDWRDEIEKANAAIIAWESLEAHLTPTAMEIIHHVVIADHQTRRPQRLVAILRGMKAHA